MKSHPQSASLSERAYNLVKHRIISLELPPGSVIDEAALSASLDVGRTPLREALQRLARERLVVIVPRRGTFVSEIGIMDLQRLFEVRVVLESLAGRLAALRGSEEQWRQMEAVLAALPAEDVAVDNQVLIEIDEACHQIIHQAIDNTFLHDILATLYALSLRLWYFSLPQIGDMREAIVEHQAILKALQARDAERAALLLQQHILRFQEEIQGTMLGVGLDGNRQGDAAMPHEMLEKL
jgi:DNA-binding GntR family transcriptional regulator